LVVQRVGQDIFRDGLIEYWQGRCAVTGLAVTSLLRASHIKPWASCETDAERLDVFNGLLLSPNLDAAFDRGYITLADDGAVLVSVRLDRAALVTLGLDAPMRIRALTPSHLHYLKYHRANVFQWGELPRTAASTPAVFQRYIGVDYSGAQTPSSGLNGIRVFVATPETAPKEAACPARGHWSRRALAEWLIEQLADGPPTIVGIDHCFSFPKAYFEEHGLALDWPRFLDDFCAHWPTHEDVYVDFVREGVLGNGAARQGNTRWRRLTEIRAGGAKSAFHFDVPGSVAKSTHAGLPWLRRIREDLGDRVHFWPFDGWKVRAGRSAIVEVYPSLWRARFPLVGADEHQQDAYAVAACLRETDGDGSLASLLAPQLAEADQKIARFEGWILGVGVDK
jgi:hypothetical protein